MPTVAEQARREARAFEVVLPWQVVIRLAHQRALDARKTAETVTGAADAPPKTPA